MDQHLEWTLNKFLQENDNFWSEYLGQGGDGVENLGAGLHLVLVEVTGTEGGVSDVPEDDGEGEEDGEPKPPEDLSAAGLPHAARYDPVQGLWECNEGV